MAISAQLKQHSVTRSSPRTLWAGQSLANEIFNPTTARRDPVTGNQVSDPFPGNIIPMSMMDPVALKIQNQIPLPNLQGLTNNYLPIYDSVRHTTIPGVKIDHQINEKQHFILLVLYPHRFSILSDLRPVGRSASHHHGGPRYIHSFACRAFELRLYDLADLAAPPRSGLPAEQLLRRCADLGFQCGTNLRLGGCHAQSQCARFQGFCPPAGIAGVLAHKQAVCPTWGRSPDRATGFFEKPSGDTSITWIRGNSSYKLGADVFFLAIPAIPYTGTNGVYGFSANETNQPYLAGQTFAGLSAGFPYASFLLGNVDNFSIAAPAGTGNQSLSGGCSCKILEG